MKFKINQILTFFLCSLSFALQAQVITFFADSPQSSYYDAGSAVSTAPSGLEKAGPNMDKIPVEASVQPYEGSNFLRVSWTSATGGSWAASVSAPALALQNISATDVLTFAVYSKTGLGKDSLPSIFFGGAPGAASTGKYAIGAYAGAIPAGIWTQVFVPLSVFFNDPLNKNVDFTHVLTVGFIQGIADGVSHTLFIDDVKTYNSTNIAGLAKPTGLVATGYEKHIDLAWDPASAAQTNTTQIWRSNDQGANYSLTANVATGINFYEDFISTDSGKTLRYKILAASGDGSKSAFSDTASASTKPMSDLDFLDMTQRATFRYFWDFGHPVSGMARERNTSGDVVTTGGSGFGVMGLLAGIQRGYVSRSDGLNRLMKIVTFLGNADRFKGAWPHWMDGRTGKVIPFSDKDNGGDLVETAFMIQGLLTARQFFNGASSDETTLRQKITQLWEDVDWNWYRQNGQNVLYWHWSPNYNFAINLPIRGWNETMIVYILAIASPTHGVPASLYTTGWAGGAYLNGNSPYGYKLDVGPNNGGPLFFAHYSFLGFDPRNKKDAYTNYFIRNKNHTLITRAYCIQNPGNYKGYSDQNWGLTASDDPGGYRTHSPVIQDDNGTITPTAALSSTPYTPSESISALKYFYRNLGVKVWGGMGFYDAFNQDRNWFAMSYLAIDQGPIIDMIENYRTGLLWKNFMLNPEIQPALDNIGFKPDSAATATVETKTANIKLYPNPATNRISFSADFPENDLSSLTLLNGQGQIIRNWKKELMEDRNRKEWSLPVEGLPGGMYFFQARGNQWVITRKIVLFASGF